MQSLRGSKTALNGKIGKSEKGRTSRFTLNGRGGACTQEEKMQGEKRKKGEMAIQLGFWGKTKNLRMFSI